MPCGVCRDRHRPSSAPARITTWSSSSGLKSEWLAEIAAHGGRALEPLPPSSYIIALDGPAYDWITTVPSYVHSVLHYGAEMRVDAGLTETLNSDPLLTRGLIRGEPAPAAGVTRRGTRVHNLQRAFLRGG